MMNIPFLAYFDHNVLSDLTDIPKISTDHFFGKFSENNIVPVFSDENLREVIKSSKRIDLLLDLLTDYEFQYIYEEMVDFNLTDQIKLEYRNPRERYENIIESSEQFPDDFTNFDFVRKMFGAQMDESFYEIVLNQTHEAEAQLREFMAGDTSLLTIEQQNKIKGSIHKLKETRRLLKEQKSDLTKLDSADNSAVSEIRKICEVASGELNNIQGEQILQRIWEKVGAHFGAPERTLADFFDLDINQFSDDYRFSRSIPTRVSSIYQQLNLIGYWKDDKMHTERRFNAAQSDGIHVGMAAMCQLFFCNDNRCRLKAHAAFEYVGSKCKIVETKIRKD